jgi:GntR family transcriptional repressor for pyruvate dehydrogenase complex
MHDAHGPALRPARRRTLTDEIMQQLLELIAGGEGPELKLPPERVLCDELQVSRPALREAVSALTQMGVVEMRAQAKYGSPLRAQTQLLSRGHRGADALEESSSAFEVRRMLEPQVAARAAERATASALREMERWVIAMEEAEKDPAQVVELDLAFHSAVARATRNDVVMQVVTALNEAARDDRVASYRPREAAAVAATGHRKILEAIKAGDAPAARRAMERHLKDAEKLLGA